MKVMNGENTLVHAETIGSVTAEVYLSNGRYFLFLVGDHLASLLGSSQSLQDCKEEIMDLRCLAESDQFSQTIAQTIAEYS